MRLGPAVVAGTVALVLKCLRPIGHAQDQGHLGLARGDDPPIPGHAHPEVAQIPIPIAGQGRLGKDASQLILQDVVPLPGVGAVGIAFGDPAFFLSRLQLPSGFRLTDELGTA